MHNTSARAASLHKYLVGISEVVIFVLDANHVNVPQVVRCHSVYAVLFDTQLFRRHLVVIAV
jgi:hypothetical protein